VWESNPNSPLLTLDASRRCRFRQAPIAVNWSQFPALLALISFPNVPGFRSFREAPNGRSSNSFALGRQSALAEAHGLYRMIQAECSVEQLRELIAVPPRIERVLLAYAKAHVEDAHWIGASAPRGQTCQKSTTESLIPSSKAARPRRSTAHTAQQSRKKQVARPQPGAVSHDSADERGRVCVGEETNETVRRAASRDP
jgi:hypothetical protein